MHLKCTRFPPSRSIFSTRTRVKRGTEYDFHLLHSEGAGEGAEACFWVLSTALSGHRCS